MGNFIFALEFLGADVNYEDEQNGKTIFHEILKTPKSGKFIECSIENGADCYSVRKDIFIDHKQIFMFPSHFRNYRTIDIQFILSSNPFALKTSKRL